MAVGHIQPLPEKSTTGGVPEILIYISLSASFPALTSPVGSTCITDMRTTDQACLAAHFSWCEAPSSSQNQHRLKTIMSRSDWASHHPAMPSTPQSSIRKGAGQHVHLTSLRRLPSPTHLFRSALQSSVPVVIRSYPLLYPGKSLMVFSK